MKIHVEIDADVRHLHHAITLCNLFDGFYKSTPSKDPPDDFSADLVPALHGLFVLLDSAPEGYDIDVGIEWWAAEGGELTRPLIGLLRKVADRMEKAISGDTHA